MRATRSSGTSSPRGRPMRPVDAAAHCGYLSPVSSWDRSSRFVIAARNAMVSRRGDEAVILAQRATYSDHPAAEDLGDVVYHATRKAAR